MTKFLGHQIKAAFYVKFNAEYLQESINEEKNFLC